MMNKKCYNQWNLLLYLLGSDEKPTFEKLIINVTVNVDIIYLRKFLTSDFLNFDFSFRQLPYKTYSCLHRMTATVYFVNRQSNYQYFIFLR